MKAMLIIDSDKITSLDDVIVTYQVRDKNNWYRLVRGMKTLRELPEKYSKDHLSSFGGDYYTGYNHCLEDILGEEE